MLTFRRSKVAFWVAGSFLALAIAAFAMHMGSVYTNPANSGESGILLVPFALPWIHWLPSAFFRSAVWDNPVLAGWWVLVGLNAFVLFCLFGGLGRRPSPATSSRPGPGS